MYKTFNETAELDLKTIFQESSPEIASCHSKPGMVEYLTPLDRIGFTSICVGYKNKTKN